MGCHAGPREMAGEASPRSAGGCRMRNALELVEVDSDRLEEVLRRAEQSLDEKDAELIRAVFESYAYVTELVEDKNTTIRRLRQLFFGARTEKTEAVVGPKTGTSEVTASPDAAAETESAAGEGTTDVSDAAAVSKGHGRNGAEAYRGAERIDVAHPSLACGRRVSRLRRGHRLREGPGRAGADHRAAAAGGDGLPVAEAALPSVRPGLHRGCARRGGRDGSTTPRPAA